MEAIRQLYYNMTDDGIIGWVLFILLAACCLTVIGIAIYGILSVIDYCFLPVKEGKGQIVAMYFEHSHYTTRLVSTGKTLTPITTWHPDAWKITVQIDGLNDDVYVSQNQYLSIRIKQKVSAIYTNGRIWKTLYIKQLSF